MVRDVIDGLKLVADGVQSVKTITDAIKNGKDYVKNTHPEIQGDLRALAAELEKSLLVITRASAVLTNFWFAIATDSQGRELARFNDYFIKSKEDEAHLEEHIDDLRTHCSKVREHAGSVAKGYGVPAYVRIFRFLGLDSPEREEELAEQLVHLANEDFQVANSAQRMLKCLNSALKDVQNALGEGGAMYPENIPAAAALLAEYGPHFQKMEDRATEAVKAIRELVQELD